MIDNKKLLKVQGHEIWRKQSASMNADVVLSLAYGDNMYQDEFVFITALSMGAK